MTIDEKMVIAIQNIVAEFGPEHVMTRAEIIDLMEEKYHIARSSTIPSDYCYNRVNNGISLSKPTLFEYLEKGEYRCRGGNFPYNGPIYHKSRSTNSEQVVGICRNGVCEIYGIDSSSISLNSDEHTQPKRYLSVHSKR